MVGFWETVKMEDAFLANPAATWEQIRSLPGREGAQLRPDLLFERYAGENPREAWAMARAILDPGIQSSVMLTVAASAKIPLSERRNMVLDYLKQADQERSIACVTALMEAYGNSEPWAGSQSLSELPGGPVRDAAVTVLAKTWSQLDAPSASEWIAELPSGRARDLAVRELTANSVDDPEVALLNVARIGDQSLRREAARIVFDAWHAMNPGWIADLARRAGLSTTEIKDVSIAPVVSVIR